MIGNEVVVDKVCGLKCGTQVRALQNPPVHESFSLTTSLTIELVDVATFNQFSKTHVSNVTNERKLTQLTL